MSTGPHPSGGSVATDGNVFAAEIKRWRDVRGLSRAALAKQMGYDRSYVSKVESGAERPSREFALHAEAALRAGGAVRQAFHEYVASRPARPARTSLTVLSGGANEAGDPLGSLVVDHDDAALAYDGETYRLTQRRRLVNGGGQPISRYLIRISVDRFPNDPERSNELYAAHPLTWDEVNLRAWHGEGRTEPMHWTPHHDREAFKEVWLLFANDVGRFPLYPGESCWIEYEYTIADEHWGNWFQRAVRLPTRRLSVRLELPTELDPVVWGLHTSMTAESMPFPTAIDRRTVGERQVFSWATQDPPLHARYRLEWDFRARRSEQPGGRPQPAETMKSLGVAQRDDPRLRRRPRSFSLPREADDARQVLAALRSAVERVAQVHVFGKGLGVAAPQIGIDRAAAVVVPAALSGVAAGPGTKPPQPIELINPRIIEESPETDEQYEGCLSFFDYRGLVPRPLVIHVEHQDLDGRRKITVFERSVARLVAHEIDHLAGRLYTDRMRPGAELIPVEQYGGTGLSWSYHH